MILALREDYKIFLINFNSYLQEFKEHEESRKLIIEIGINFNLIETEVESEDYLNELDKFKKIVFAVRNSFPEKDAKDFLSSGLLDQFIEITVLCFIGK